MPKALCIASMAISVLVLILFFSDLILGFTGMKSVAPFKSFSMLMDIVFILASAGWAALSWFTFREQA
jgi:hypothetical protein